MQLKNRIKRISDAMRAQAETGGNKPFLTLEQWKRHADGEDIRSEIPIDRRAEFDEWKRRADERLKEVERIYLLHNPELLEDYEKQF